MNCSHVVKILLDLIDDSSIQDYSHLDNKTTESIIIPRLTPFTECINSFTPEI